VVETVHTDFVTSGRQISGKLRRLGHHGAEQEERCLDIALSQNCDEIGRRCRIWAVVECEGDVSGVTLAGQSAKESAPNRPEASDPWTSMRDREPGACRTQPDCPATQDRCSGR